MESWRLFPPVWRQTGLCTTSHGVSAGSVAAGLQSSQLDSDDSDLLQVNTVSAATVSATSQWNWKDVSKGSFSTSIFADRCFEECLCGRLWMTGPYAPKMCIPCRRWFGFQQIAGSMQEVYALTRDMDRMKTIEVPRPIVDCSMKSQQLWKLTALTSINLNRPESASFNNIGTNKHESFFDKIMVQDQNYVCITVRNKITPRHNESVLNTITNLNKKGNKHIQTAKNHWKRITSQNNPKEKTKTPSLSSSVRGCGPNVRASVVGMIGAKLKVNQVAWWKQGVSEGVK